MVDKLVDYWVDIEAVKKEKILVDKSAGLTVA